MIMDGLCMRTRALLIYLVVLLLLLPVLVFAEVYLSPQEAIKEIFPDYQEYKTQTHAIGQQKVKVFSIFKDNKLIGWAVVLDELGLKEPITFLVGIDTQGKVLDVYVLEYLEPHGFNIREKSFMKQFQGKSIASPLTIGQDIDGVTHATISSKAAVVAVRKALQVIEDSRRKSPHA